MLGLDQRGEQGTQISIRSPEFLGKYLQRLGVRHLSLRAPKPQGQVIWDLSRLSGLNYEEVNTVRVSHSCI